MSIETNLRQEVYNGVEEWHFMADKIRKGDHFCLSRWNDGEHILLTKGQIGPNIDGWSLRPGKSKSFISQEMGMTLVSKRFHKVTLAKYLD